MRAPASARNQGFKETQKDLCRDAALVLQGENKSVNTFTKQQLVQLIVFLLLGKNGVHKVHRCTPVMQVYTPPKLGMQRVLCKHPEICC